jgi:hypothetical protein
MLAVADSNDCPIYVSNVLVEWRTPFLHSGRINIASHWINIHNGSQSKAESRNIGTMKISESKFQI